MVAERRVAAACVVEAFNEVEDGPAGLLVIPEYRAVDQLALERGEEALTHGVVVAVAHRSHRRPHAGFATAPAELDRGVLATLIRVMDHFRWRALGQGHLQCGCDQR